MKRTVVFCLLAAMLVSSLAACSGGKGPEQVPTASSTSTSSETAETATTTPPLDGAATTATSATTEKTTAATAEKTTATTAQGTNTTSKTTTASSTTATTKTGSTGCLHENCREATCLVAAICLKCGRVVGQPLGHSYVDNVCVRCGQKSPEYMSRVEVLGVELDAETVEMLIGDTVQLNGTLVPENATDQTITWASSNPAAVQVSSSGKLTGVALGVSTITATSVNGKKATCKVTVGDVAVEMPELPANLRYPADYSKKSWIALDVTDVSYRYTQTGANEGTLLLQFVGVISYAGDGDGHYTTPSIGWRLYDSNNTAVAEGVCKASEAKRVGSALKGMTAEVSGVAPGRYRLELYDTYEQQQ